MATNPDIELSVVMPCLNEADTLRTCIRKAIRAMNEAGIVGEVIVADNGSTDGSQEIARSEGARVVDIPVRGYGSALIGGIAEARGKFILMGDADDSYDFTEIPRFVAALREGAELVQGCRLPKGGGTVLPGAMPFLHRWWGNPMFTAMARRWFGAPINDINCGMRAFSRDLYDRLELRSLGMEFANEMIIKASLMGARISEVPITLHPDGRKSHGPHLRTFRDGWRTLRFYLIFSPTWLFLIPGVLLILFGVLGMGVGLTGTTIGGLRFETNTLLFSSVAMLCGFQAIVFWALARVYAVYSGLLPRSRVYDAFFRWATLERVVVLGVIGFVAGGVLLGSVMVEWVGTSFGELEFSGTMRRTVPGATLTALGFQTMLSGFLASILGMDRR